MSKKTQITILFITMTIICIIFRCIYKIQVNSNCYEYSLVNTANDKDIKDTSDKNQNIISNSNSENKNNEQINNVSRNLEIDRSKKNDTNISLEFNKLLNPISTYSAKYVDTYSEKMLIKEENMYGVKVLTYDNITYNIYPDGYKEIINSVESIEIDSSNYNGTTQLLINEAKQNLETYFQNINEILNITNKYRNEVGLNQLTLDKELCEAASVRALEMAYTSNLSHIRPDGAKCFVVLKDFGINYTCVAENIADGYKDSEDVCNAWKSSEGHYKNIICNKYNKIGIGVAKSVEGKYYWVQLFSN